MVNRDRQMYFVPAEKDKINNVRRWEQAFRVYATIYSQCNPQRSPEIWQYIHIINTAASSFAWENVANYDFTFRNLMAAYPQRSWAKTYTQMWNIAMRDPINRMNKTTSKDRDKDDKSDFCWKFNKGICNHGRVCKWEHRCFYCKGWGHPVSSCRKKQGKDGSNNTSNRDGKSPFQKGDKSSK